MRHGLPIDYIIKYNIIFLVKLVLNKIVKRDARMLNQTHHVEGMVLNFKSVNR